jgi:Mrp family chromosome partitioning ATPase
LRMNQSMRALGTLALDGLAKVGANVLGAVANDVSAGKGYRKYGGAWQYASRAERYSGEVAAVGAGSRNGEARGNGAREAGRVEVLSISEPDWSADVR